MHPWIKMSVKREAEMCQIQAGWPTNCQLQTDANPHRHLDKIRSVHEKDGDKWQESQADQPMRGWPAPLCSVSSPGYAWKLSTLTLPAFN